MPRLFTALQIPVRIARSLTALQGGLHNARWIERESMHITLRFIGDVDRHTANEIHYALEKIKHSAFSLKLHGLDVFGAKKPRSLYACVKGSKNNENALEALQATHERIIQRIGISSKSRKYTPHVTLARLNGHSAASVASWLSMRGEYASEDFDISSFVLYSAKGSVGGGPYVIEKEYNFCEKG